VSTTPGSDLPFRTILLPLSALSTCRLPWRSPLDPNDLERTRRVQDRKFRNRFRYSIQKSGKTINSARPALFRFLLSAARRPDCLSR
jgi:hypothetical protein